MNHASRIPFLSNLAWLSLTISLTGQIEAASLASLNHMVHSLLEPLCQRAEHASRQCEQRR